MKSIAVVIPTIRPDSYIGFLMAWESLFEKHNVKLITVFDGDKPFVIEGTGLRWYADEIMDESASCLSNYVAGIRNLGFAYVAKRCPEIEYIITLDDDEVPIGDPIQDHIDALNMRVPISWMSTASEYMRGFPYGVRDEAEVVLSHGVWEGVADWDAPTQLVKGSKREVEFFKGPIPKGIYYPMCSMNLAFKRKMLPYIYHAPKALGVVRANDIFAGIVSKRVIDQKGWAAVTGYARVYHDRASNTFKNLVDESVEIGLYETFWKGDESHPYFRIYQEKYRIWKKFIKTCKI